MRLTAAEFAARRHLVGVTVDHMADHLHVNPRTVRAWESGRDLIPERISEELADLIDEHTRLVEAMLISETPVALPRNPETRVKGWFVAAAARAVATDPDIELEWK